MRRVASRGRVHRGKLSAMGLALICGFVASCNGGDASTNSVLSESTSTRFTGPWAVEFESAYVAAASEFVRIVLQDEQITDEEVAEARERFVACLAGVGYEATGFQPDGSFDLTPPQGASESTVREVHDRCSDESGESAIGSLHSWLRRNPENLDESTILAACLVRAGVVDVGYSAEQYRHDWESESGPLDPDGPGAAAFRLCNADPLDILG